MIDTVPNDEVKDLFELIHSDRNAVPDKSGVTPLIAKAAQNNSLDELNPKKRKAEETVAQLVKYFHVFDETDFSNLEMYIQSSTFAKDIIRDKYSMYLLSGSTSLNLIIKANLIRFLQRISNNVITKSIISSISKLEKDDPWLYTEILLQFNWKQGVGYIKKLLRDTTTYDSSYLFSLLPDLTYRHTKEETEYALQEWYNELNSEDKKLAEMYAENHGFNLATLTTKEITANNLFEIIKPALNGYINVEPRSTYRSLSHCFK